jgi:hypothetical protein
VDVPAEEAARRVVIGIETDRGPWVRALIAAGYVVFAINPMQVARYRQRHSTSGAKSDAGDAHVLAEIVRLDREHHRPVAGDSADAEAVQLLARSHQSMIWDRTRQVLRLRSALREFFPAALAAFDDLSAPDTLELLARAPDPNRAARLSQDQLAGAPGRAKRRNVEARADPLQAVLRAPALRQPAGVQQAYAAIVVGQVRLILALNAEIDALEKVVADHFGRHRDAEIYLSQPGLGTVLSARILAEFGDDPDRFATAKSRKNYAGTSPITRASGTSRIVLARYARNRRLADALHQWAFCSLKGSPWPTATGARGELGRGDPAPVRGHRGLRRAGRTVQRRPQWLPPPRVDDRVRAVDRRVASGVRVPAGLVRAVTAARVDHALPGLAASDGGRSGLTGRVAHRRQPLVQPGSAGQEHVGKRDVRGVADRLPFCRCGPLAGRATGEAGRHGRLRLRVVRGPRVVHRRAAEVERTRHHRRPQPPGPHALQSLLVPLQHRVVVRAGRITGQRIHRTVVLLRARLPQPRHQRERQHHR